MPSSHTILVVDDDEDIRDALAEVLKTTGRTVLSAANGREAIDILRTGPVICVVLLDMKMPVMDGYRFLELRRRDPHLARVPVAVISAGAVDQDRIDGATQLSKPLKIPQLLEVIDRYCQVRK